MSQQRGGGSAGAQRPNGASQGRICQFKLVLLGESAVGKSSLVLRFVKGQFHEYQESTIGAAFLTQTVSMEDSEVKFEIWDTAGQERYNSLAPMYYRGAQAAIVVYDIMNQDSYQRAQTWVSELQRKVSDSFVMIKGGDGGDAHCRSLTDGMEIIAGWVVSKTYFNIICPLPGLTKYCNCLGGQQGRPGQQSNGGVRGGETVRRGERAAVHGDVRQDGAECKRDLLGNRCVVGRVESQARMTNVN